MARSACDRYALGMVFLRSLAVGLGLASIVFLLVTLFSPQLSFEAPGSTVSSLRAGRDARVASLEHRGVVGLLASGAWEHTVDDDVKRARKMPSYASDEAKWLRDRISVLDGQIKHAASMRDRFRYGLFVTVLLAALSAALVRAARGFEGRAQGRVTLLALLLLLVACAAPIPSDNGSPWFALAVAIVVALVTLAAGLAEDHPDRASLRSAPHEGSPA